jgi:hypothetical protein
MADERRKGPPDRRRTRAAKAPQDDQKATTTPPAATPDAHSRGQDPNDVARFDAEELDKSIRTRELEDRGEVF